MSQTLPPTAGGCDRHRQPPRRRGSDGPVPLHLSECHERGPRGLLQFTRRLLTGSSGRQPGNLLRWSGPRRPLARAAGGAGEPAPGDTGRVQLRCAVGQDTGEGDIRLGVPPEALESQRRRYRPSPLPSTCHPNSASRLTPSRHLNREDIQSVRRAEGGNSGEARRKKNHGLYVDHHSEWRSYRTTYRW